MQNFKKFYVSVIYVFLTLMWMATIFDGQFA